MHSHVQALNDDKAAKCPHPQCFVSFDSVQDLQHHLQDIHCVTVARVLKRCRSDPTPERDDVRVKRPRRAAGRKGYGHDAKPQFKASAPGMKSMEAICTPDGEMKYTFITCTAEAFQSSDRSSIIPKKPGRECEQPTMTRQRSGSVTQEYPLFMDSPVEGCLLDVGDGKRHMSATPSVKSEDTPISCFTPDEVTAAVETPESSVTSDFLQCIDPRLLEMSDAMQSCTQPNDTLPHSDDLTNAVPRIAQCPVCRTEVDADFLRQYTNGEARVKLRVQMAFCMAHKKKSAE